MGACRGGKPLDETAEFANSPAELGHVKSYDAQPNDGLIAFCQRDDRGDFGVGAGKIGSAQKQHVQKS